MTGLSSVLLSVLLAAGAAETAEKVDLKGVVKDDMGAPVKDATVLIFTAQPRKGVGTLCPSCYLDCWRQARTDEKGRFTIEKVDGSLLFKIGALTPGHEPAFASKVDPVAGEPEITLWPKANVPDEPRRTVRARLVDLDGKGVAHAVVTTKGIREGMGNSYGSHLEATTITDEKGAFTLTGKKDADFFILEMTARGLATTIFDVPPKKEEQTLTLGPGVAVRGRAMRDGKPVAGLTFSLVQLDRSSGNFVGESTSAVTNAEGRFVLANVVPHDLLAMYSKTLDAATSGATSVKYVETGEHGSVIDVGDLPVRAARRLTGRLVMPAGTTVPPDSSVRIGRPIAWDSISVPVAADGAFAADVVPDEPLTVSVGVRGHRLTDTQGRARRSRTIAPLEQDRELTLTLEAGSAR